MALNLAQQMKDPGYRSLEKEFLMDSNSSFRKLAEQIRRVRSLKIFEKTTFCFIAMVLL